MCGFLYGFGFCLFGEVWITFWLYFALCWFLLSGLSVGFKVSIFGKLEL
jgi:hypothetical protein